MMPSGGGSPLNEDEWEFVRKTFDAARKHGLEYEWLRWFAGTLVRHKMTVKEAAMAAAIEWDF
jgi:hypothetical protein